MPIPWGRFWIFQSRVDRYYDIRASCTVKDRVEVWPFKQHPYRKQLKRGQHCFVWASGKDLTDGEKGIYAIGRLESDLYDADLTKYPEFRHGYEYPGDSLEILVKYVRPLTKHISKAVFAANPVLGQNQIIAFPMLTVFAVTDKQKQIIWNMIG